MKRLLNILNGWFFCDHNWEKVGEKYEDIRHECTKCKAIGWHYSDDVSYDDWLIHKLNRELNIPLAAGRVLLMMEDVLREAESYDWTEKDTIEFAKVLKAQRRLALEANKKRKVEVCPNAILEDTILQTVIPKFGKVDYELVEDAINLVRIPEKILKEKMLDF